jgi:hypothetical protein
MTFPIRLHTGVIAESSPGPWHYHAVFECVRDHNDRPILGVGRGFAPPPPPVPTECTLANLQLAASAPALLAILERILTDPDSHLSNDTLDEALTVLVRTGLAR